MIYDYDTCKQKVAETITNIFSKHVTEGAYRNVAQFMKKANGSHVTGTIRSLVEKNKELDALLRARSTAADAQSIDDANKALMDAWLKHLAEFGVDHADVVDRQKQIAKAKTKASTTSRPRPLQRKALAQATVQGNVQGSDSPQPPLAKKLRSAVKAKKEARLGGALAPRMAIKKKSQASAGASASAGSYEEMLKAFAGVPGVSAMIGGLAGATLMQMGGVGGTAEGTAAEAPASAHNSGRDDRLLEDFSSGEDDDSDCGNDIDSDEECGRGENNDCAENLDRLDRAGVQALDGALKDLFGN